MGGFITLFLFRNQALNAMNSTNRVFQIAFVGLIIIILSGALYFELRPKPTTPEYPIVLTDLGVRPDFTLPSTTGSNFTLSSTNGKVRLVTFIYTKCMEGCATLTANMATTMSQLQAANLTNQVQFVTIDFDFLFDNMSDLTNYAANFTQPSYPWVWLLGNQNQTETITQQWGFYYNLTSSPSTNTTSYTQLTPDHTGMVEYTHIFEVFVLDGAGHWQYTLLGANWTPATAMQVIQKVMDLNTTTS